MDDDVRDALVDRLIAALAAQVGDAALAPGAVAALAELTRAEAHLFFTTAGHDVHYGTSNGPTARLIGLVSDVQRALVPDAGGVLRVGDEVHVIQEVLPPEERSGVPWWGEVVHTVRYIGDDDGTVDVQPELTQEYVIETIPSATLRPAPASKPA